MPGFDGTGPFGLGPMTGRGRGYCVMRPPSSGCGIAWGYAGLMGWPFATIAARGAFPTYPLLIAGLGPMQLALFSRLGPAVAMAHRVGFSSQNKKALGQIGR